MSHDVVVSVSPLADAQELALSVSGISKTFGATKALDDVSLEVRPGEVHALMGQNGCGKSTLVKVLAGFHRPDHNVEARSHQSRFAPGDAAAVKAAGVRFIHQDLGLVPSLSVMDNLALGAGYATRRGGSIDWRVQRETARRDLADLGYDLDVRRLIEDLEPVERTAVAIARALRDNEQAGLLVFDEPTATMPGPDVVRLHELIRQLCARGAGVVYVSHHIDEVLALADRVTVLRDGRNVATVDVADLTPRSLVSLMTGDAEAGQVEARDASLGDAVLSVRNLGGHVVRHLDLEVRAGEVVGIAGIEGSGRGEVAGLIFGERTRTGTVHVAGTALEQGVPRRAVESGLGYVPADRASKGLHVDMSVAENLTIPDLGPITSGPWLRRRRERDEAKRVGRRFNVRMSGVKAEVHHLSGGNQQKVLMAKWLRTEPRVLLLDEPTQGVDVKAKHEIHALILEAARNGAGVLVCSSDEQELEQLCDRVIVLRHGIAAVQLDRSNISAAHIVAESLISTSKES